MSLTKSFKPHQQTHFKRTMHVFNHTRSQ